MGNTMLATKLDGLLKVWRFGCFWLNFSKAKKL